MLMPSGGFGDNQVSENPGNWVAFCRDVEHHPIVGFGQPMKPANPKRGAYSKNEAWQFLVFRAEFKRKRVTNKGRVIWLERGELMGARSWFAERWNWTEKAVRKFLEALEDDMMIRRFWGHNDDRLHGRSTGIISVCNYNKYQIERDLEELLGDQSTGHSGATQGPLRGHTINKETNKQEDTPHSPPKGTARKSAPPKKTRLPDDWILPDEWRQWAREKRGLMDGQIDWLAEDFHRYWTGPDAKGGGRKADWKRTWQTGVDMKLSRGAVPKSNGFAGHNPNQKPEGVPDDVWQDMLEEKRRNKGGSL